MEVPTEELQVHIRNGLESKVSTDYSKQEEVSKATERRLNVEDELFKKKGNVNDEYMCNLQEIAVKFAENSPILPLTVSNDYLGKCSHFPGVYLIYYIGVTSLYGDLVTPSRDRPIYVGMSTCDILFRLSHHCNKVTESHDLKKEDFVVRLMIVDIEYYAPSIEHMLVEYYSPLWNDWTVNFSFGNAGDENNNWNKYHVAKDEDTRKNMIERVKYYLRVGPKNQHSI